MIKRCDLVPINGLYECTGAFSALIARLGGNFRKIRLFPLYVLI